MAEKNDYSLDENAFAESFRKQCSHYSRGCSIVAPCCSKVYDCRVCHNEKENHEVDRFAVKEIICRNCNECQEVSKKCCKCLMTFARYSCFICNLFDDAEKGQYHCSKCGICRIGGKDNFFHCDTCGLCLQKSLKEAHKCVEEASRSNCPVCMEDLHSSRTAAHVPKCGHLIHNTCFQDMIKNNLYQCPQCQTSIVNMTAQWEALDRERDQWLLPLELRNFQVKVQCRDCQMEDNAIFHFVGLRCVSCGSYNTVRCGNETLPLDDIDPANLVIPPHVQMPFHFIDNDSEEEEEEEEGEEPEDDLLVMLENRILRPMFGPLPDDESSDETYYEEEEEDDDDDDDDNEENIVFQILPFLPNDIRAGVRGILDQGEERRLRELEHIEREILNQEIERQTREEDGNQEASEGATPVENEATNEATGGNTRRQFNENNFMELVNAIPHLLNLHNEDEFVNFLNEDEEDNENPGLINNQFYYTGEGGDPYEFLPYVEELEAARRRRFDNNPQIWEVTDDEEENMNGQENGSNEWVTSSEEEIIGGDEENLGKEECLIPEEEENQLDDVAPAN